MPKPLPSALLTMILLCLIGQPTCLTWTPYGIYAIFSREIWETVDPTIQTSWRLNSATDWSLPCHTSLMLEFVLKEPRPSIECRNEHTLKNLNFSVLQILFWLYNDIQSCILLKYNNKESECVQSNLRKYSNILRYWFLTFICCKP